MRLNLTSLGSRSAYSKALGTDDKTLDADIVRGVCQLYAADYSCLGFSLPKVCRDAVGDEAAGDEAVADEAAEVGWAVSVEAEIQEQNQHQDHKVKGGEGQNAVYPGEWHDTDVGLATHVQLADADTRTLLKTLTKHLLVSHLVVGRYCEISHQSFFAIFPSDVRHCVS